MVTEDNFARIIRESYRIITRLQVLAAFFEDEEIYKIYLRTQTNHQLFENNRELDINKLELFHIQFTATTIELLKKIKKGNEQNVSVLFDEIQINNDLAAKLGGLAVTEKSYQLEKQNQSLKVNLTLRRLYQQLSDDSSDDPFSKNIQAFGLHYAADFYYEISAAVLEDVTGYKPEDVYVNSFAVIQKKLMGNLCKYEFKSEFYAGFKCGTLLLEVYKFLEADRYFSFMVQRNMFLFCDPLKLVPGDFSNSLSKKARLVDDLHKKNMILEAQAKERKTFLPSEIKALLVETYNKISNISFLENLTNVDAQANILKTMLNTDSL